MCVVFIIIFLSYNKQAEIVRKKICFRDVAKNNIFGKKQKIKNTETKEAQKSFIFLFFQTMFLSTQSTVL